MGRYVFIDFDGTLADRGEIPVEHLRAVREAQRRGHRIMLCTGRPRSLVRSRDRAIFDGVIASAGGYVELDGQVIYDRRFPAGLGARVIAALDHYNAAFILEAPDGVYAHRGTAARIAGLLDVANDGASASGRTAEDILTTVQGVDDLRSVSYAKVVCFDADRPLAEIAAPLAPEVAMVPSSMAALGDRAGELYLAEVNKSVGIGVVAERLGIDRGRIVAIGDGHNDLEMLQYADVAVAIDGAPQSVLAAADLVVPPPGRAGLVEGFARLGLTA